MVGCNVETLGRAKIHDGFFHEFVAKNLGVLVVGSSRFSGEIANDELAGAEVKGTVLEKLGEVPKAHGCFRRNLQFARVDEIQKQGKNVRHHWVQLDLRRRIGTLAKPSPKNAHKELAPAFADRDNVSVDVVRSVDLVFCANFNLPVAEAFGRIHCPMQIFFWKLLVRIVAEESRQLDHHLSGGAVRHGVRIEKRRRSAAIVVNAAAAAAGG